MEPRFSIDLDCKHYAYRKRWLAFSTDGQVLVRFDACDGCAALVERVALPLVPTGEEAE